MKEDIDKQKEMVSILWEFAHDLQNNRPDSWSTNHDTWKQTAMNMKAIRKAMQKLADNFELELIEIQ